MNQVQPVAGSQCVIDPSTGLPIVVAPYDEENMHVDQTNIIGNAEDFEGVEQEPRSHDFQSH